jgi:hypothetical protein
MSPAYTVDPEASSTAATLRGKHFPWKNVCTYLVAIIPQASTAFQNASSQPKSRCT